MSSCKMQKYLDLGFVEKTEDGQYMYDGDLYDSITELEERLEEELD